MSKKTSMEALYMTKENIVRIHRIYNILLSISIVLAGICMIAGCLNIYFTGEHTYSREIVAETFSKIAIPVYVCLALTIGSFVWELIQPSKMQPQKSSKAYAFMRNRLCAQKDFSKCDDALLTSISKERNSRKFHVIIRSILIVISSITFLGYALNGKHFHQSEINTSMIHAMWIMIPCMLVPFGYAVFTAYHNEKSLKREIETLKQVPTLAATESADTPSVCSSGNHENIIRVGLLVIGLVVLVYGFVTGGTVDVLTKAINICTECIGLG